MTDIKTDVFITANIVDACLTYLALDGGGQLLEFNGILYSIMSMVGVGKALFLKVIFCIAVIWVLRATKKEALLWPLSAIITLVAVSNFLVLRLSS